MNKYRGFQTNKNGSDIITLKDGTKIKGEWIYTNFVEISRYFYEVLIDKQRGIPVYTAVIPETVERFNNGKFERLTEKETSEINEYLQEHLYYHLR